MKKTFRHVVALAGASVLVLGAAACSTPAGPTGSSSTPAAVATTTAAPATDAPEASEILDKAKQNALAAKSGAFTGQVDQNGETMGIEFKGTSDGKSADVSLDMGAKGKVHLIAVGEGVYMQGDSVFWKAQGAPANVQSAGDKFIKAPASAGAMTKDLNIKSFLEKAFGQVSAGNLSKTVESETINGVDVWVLTDEKGKAEGALYVSKDAYQVVRFTGSTKSPGQLDFSQWNEDLGITAPSADQIMEIS